MDGLTAAMTFLPKPRLPAECADEGPYRWPSTATAVLVAMTR